MDGSPPSPQNQKLFRDHDSPQSTMTQGQDLTSPQTEGEKTTTSHDGISQVTVHQSLESIPSQTEDKQPSTLHHNIPQVTIHQSLESIHSQTEHQQTSAIHHGIAKVTIHQSLESISPQTEHPQTKTFYHSIPQVTIHQSLESIPPEADAHQISAFLLGSPLGKMTHSLESIPLQTDAEKIIPLHHGIPQVTIHQSLEWIASEIEDRPIRAIHRRATPQVTRTHSLDFTPPQFEEPPISTFRQTLPQAIVTGVDCLLFLSLGMLIGFPALLIPELTSASEEDDIHFTKNEASWYGAMTYIFQPVGAIISGSLLQSIGCKKLMVLLNIPLFGCWILVYCAESSLALYIANAAAGAVLGLTEAPALRYISEISHPSLRGILTACSTLFVSAGILLIFFLGSLTDWRQVSLISALVPTVCTFLLFQVPETPMWLMSKGRPEAALRSLQWLRGWTSADMVKEEFEKLEFYGKKKIVKILHGYGREVDKKDEMENTATVEDTDGDIVNLSEPIGDSLKNGKPRVSFQIEECEKRSFGDKWRDLTCREMLIPLSMCFGIVSVFCLGGVPPLHPYLLKVLKDLNLPVRANWTSVWLALAGIIGNIVCMLLISRIRKKPLLIFSLGSSALCLIFLAIFIAQSTPGSAHDGSSSGWWPLILFILLFFCHNVGIHPITFIYIGEILPYRGRGIATGVAISFFFMITFVAVKSFSTMEQLLGLHGIFFFFAAVSTAGILFTYFVLPETEGKFLSDIETDITQDVRNTSAQPS